MSEIYTINDIKTTLAPVFENYHVKKAILFGSYVNNKATENSDIDLLVDSGLKGLSFVGLIEDIRNATMKEVDVLDITHIEKDSRIEKEILQNGQVIYER